MGTVALRKKLINIINSSDEKFLRMVNALQKSYFEDTGDEAVAYTFNGEPLTQADIVKNNAEAVTSIENGEFKTHAAIRQKYAVK